MLRQNRHDGHENAQKTVLEDANPDHLCPQTSIPVLNRMQATGWAILR